MTFEPVVEPLAYEMCNKGLTKTKEAAWMSERRTAVMDTARLSSVTALAGAPRMRSARDFAETASAVVR